VCFAPPGNTQRVDVRQSARIGLSINVEQAVIAFVNQACNRGNKIKLLFTGLLQVNLAGIFDIQAQIGETTGTQRLAIDFT
jgi:hypothetical protein